MWIVVKMFKQCTCCNACRARRRQELILYWWLVGREPCRFSLFIKPVIHPLLLWAHTFTAVAVSVWPVPWRWQISIGLTANWQCCAGIYDVKWFIIHQALRPEYCCNRLFNPGSVFSVVINPVNSREAALLFVWAFLQDVIRINRGAGIVRSATFPMFSH